jgi:hypothetical protein
MECEFLIDDVVVALIPRLDSVADAFDADALNDLEVLVPIVDVVVVNEMAELEWEGAVDRRTQHHFLVATDQLS